MSSSGISPRRRAERGFVLATTLLVTTLLTVMLAASFLLVSAEQRTTDNSYGTARALVLAQAGLQNYFSQHRGLDTSSTYDSLRISLAGGYADVVGRRVRPAGAITGSSLALWVVRSTGVATSQVMTGQVQGTRTIAQFAQFNPGVLPHRAAMVAANGAQMLGSGENPITGKDANFCSPKDDTTGLTVAANPYGYQSGSGKAPDGKPVGIESFGTERTVNDSTRIDWQSLLNGNFLPDYTVPPGPWPTPGSSNYLVGYFAGNVTIPGVPNGTPGMRGMLVVTGDVTMANDAHWDGIIVAGGLLQSASGQVTYTIHGMVITGLNITLGQSVNRNQIKRGSNTIQWASCYVAAAVAGLSSLVPIKNAWADTWATY